MFNGKQAKVEIGGVMCCIPVNRMGPLGSHKLVLGLGYSSNCTKSFLGARKQGVINML